VHRRGASFYDREKNPNLYLPTPIVTSKSLMNHRENIAIRRISNLIFTVIEMLKDVKRDDNEVEKQTLSLHH